MSRPVIAIAALAAAVIVGAVLAYSVFLTGDDVAPLALSSPSASPSAGASVVASPSTPASTAPSAPAATSPAATAGGGATLAGRWTVGADSVAGYRVREKLAGLSAESDAVGRTSEVTGGFDLVAEAAALVVRDASFTVRVDTLESDESRRDNRLRTSGLETDRYPEATFASTADVVVPATTLAGDVLDTELVGDLTLHGTTQPVAIPAKAQLVDGRIEILGSLELVFAEYGIVPPSIGGFVSVGDRGTLEFRLLLDKAG